MRVRSRPVRAILAGAAILVVSVAVVTMTGPDPGSAPLPGEGSAVTVVVDDQPALVVRDAAGVRAFIADPHHLDGETVWWCEGEQVFFGPAHGELFDARGIGLAGPAARNLDRVPATVVDDEVQLGDSIIRGAPRDRSLGEHHLEDVLGEEVADRYRRDPTRYCAESVEPRGAEGWWQQVVRNVREALGGHGS